MRRARKSSWARSTRRRCGRGPAAVLVFRVCNALPLGVLVSFRRMKPDVEIYDTTLRDGSQGEGINFSVADKLRLAERIAAFGVHYIEGGWPGSNPKDIEFLKDAKSRKLKHAQLAALGSAQRKGKPGEQG